MPADKFILISCFSKNNNTFFCLINTAAANTISFPRFIGPLFLNDSDAELFAIVKHEKKNPLQLCTMSTAYFIYSN